MIKDKDRYSKLICRTLEGNMTITRVTMLINLRQEPDGLPYSSYSIVVPERTNEEVEDILEDIVAREDAHFIIRAAN